MPTPKAPRDYSFLDSTAEATYQSEHSYANGPSSPTKLFDITCVIGSVYEGQSEFTPREVAFLMIARHGADGTYTFPNEDGSINSLDVATVNPSK